MKIAQWLGLLLLAITLVIVGCKESAPNKAASSKEQPAKVAEKAADKEDDAEVSTTLAKLSPEDLALAKAQRLCPVSDEPLGSMGVPPKVTIGDQPVFLCCDGCQKDALANPEKTVAKVKELKEAQGSAK